ncbi:MAG: FAD-dependent oxidoreductase [Rhizomicrobium sp.]|jgi:D-arginine dehydrogenase
MTKSADVIIIGGGIAGMSLAGRLAGRARVILVEREELLAMHTTGRSAAVFTETYGNTAVRTLTSESRSFFENPPGGFADHPLLTPRASLFVARPDHVEVLNNWLAENRRASRAVPLEEAYDRMAILRREVFAAAAEEPGAADIDVHGLFEGFRRMALHGGVEILTAAEVLGIAFVRDAWAVETTQGTFFARVVANAAGAWAGPVGIKAGLGDRGLMPLRRTAVTIEPPAGLDITNWLFVNDIGDEFYFKPEAGLVLASPVDETPSEPCDAQPEEIDVATIAWRIEEATTMKVSRIRRKWAGLRTFTPDRTPLFEFDPAAPGFFWLAGQGGYGIQTAPSISLHASRKILHYLG